MGQAVATLSGGCFADYIVVPAKLCLPAGTLQKEVVALLTSGLTASIGHSLTPHHSHPMTYHCVTSLPVCESPKHHLMTVICVTSAGCLSLLQAKLACSVLM